MQTKFERDKVYKTRDGREARIVCVDLRGTNYPIVGLVWYDNYDHIHRWTEKGENAGVSGDDCFDLMLPKPEPIVEWGRIDSRGDFRRATTEAAARDPVCWCKSADERTWRLAKRVTTFED